LPNHWFSNRKPAFRFEHSVDLVKNSGAIHAKFDHLMHSRGRYDNIKGFRIEWHFPSIALPEFDSIRNPLQPRVSLSILFAVPYQEPLVHLSFRWTIPDIYADNMAARNCFRQFYR